MGFTAPAGHIAAGSLRPPGLSPIFLGVSRSTFPLVVERKIPNLKALEIPTEPRLNIEFSRAGVYITNWAKSKKEIGNAEGEPTLTDRLPLGRFLSTARRNRAPALCLVSA